MLVAPLAESAPARFYFTRFFLLFRLYIYMLTFFGQIAVPHLNFTLFSPPPLSKIVIL